MKKFLKITGITLLILLVLAFIIPVIFKKQIQSLVKKEINKSINAKVDFSDVNLSLFRHFPKVAIILEDLSVTGLGEFAGDTLLSVKKADASAGLFSIIKGKGIKVSGIYLQSPRIHALVNKAGKANWDIAKESSGSTDSSASAFKMILKKYEINNGYLLYRDDQTNTFVEVEDFDHEGSGNLTADVFTLSTITNAKAATITQDNIPYLLNTKTDIKGDIKIDNTSSTYTFKTDDIALNNLKLSADGFFQLVNDSTYKMDIKFQSPSNDFKSILSMVPAMYTKDFSSVKTSGAATFKGFVKGIYSPQQLPAYDVNLEVKDGFFQYPDLPKPVKNIQLALRASNIDGQPDNSVINISKGHLEMDNEPFDFRFIYKNPATIQLIDAAAKGKIDLSQVSKFIKLENGTKLAGVVSADAFLKGPMQALQEQKGAFEAGGFFNIANLYYSDNSFPQPIKNGNIKATIENKGGIADKTTINISSGHIEVGNDPVDFSLQVSNPVSTANFSGAAKGRFTLVNVKQFTTLEPGTSISGLLNADLKFNGNKAIINKSEYDKLSLSGTAGLSNVKYVDKDYPNGIRISTIAASFNPSNISISNFSGSYLGSNFSGNGTVNNLLSFALSNHPLSGTINTSVDKMNLNNWIDTEENPASTPASSTTASSSPFIVPPNIDILLNANAGQVTYDKVNYNNINGSLLLSNETVKLQNVKADALEGNILINGSYSTKIDKTNPDISISYDVNDIDLQKAFLSFNTIQAIMPIGKFLSGKLNSELTMTGNLKGDMMPDLKSLTGKGNLLLIEGVLKKFAPLEKIATLLQIDRLKSISVKDIKNYFEFANGKVLVKPFKVNIEDIQMEIGGKHGFDQSIDYIIGMKVPRKYMGSQGNNLINGLVTQATSKGIPLKIGDMVDLNIKVGGSISNPSIQINLEQVVGDAMKDLEKQAVDFAKEKIDSVKDKIKDTVNSVTNRLKDSLKQKLKDQIFGKDTSNQGKIPADTAKKNEGDVIKKTLKNIFNKAKKPKNDSANKNR